MPSSAVAKRGRDEDEGEIEIIEGAKRPRLYAELLDDATHPYHLLAYKVKTVIPRDWMKNDAMKKMYTTVVDQPDAIIAGCIPYMSSWVMELHQEGKLNDAEALEKKIVSGPFPAIGGIYVHLLWLLSGLKRYVGQAKNVRQRITRAHENVNYRKRNPSLHYFYKEQALKDGYLLIASSPGLTSGPVVNILEEWTATMFLTLQPEDLEKCLPDSSIFSPADLEHGANVRHPLAQGLAPKDSPVSGWTRFRHSEDPLKKAFFEYRLELGHADSEAESQYIKDMKLRKTLLNGDLFEGEFWPLGDSYGAKDYYQFKLFRMQFLILKSHVDLVEQGSIRIRCELVDEGEEHAHKVAKSNAVLEDPCNRLAFKFSGIRKLDRLGYSVWLDTKTEKGIKKFNSLVDWLDEETSGFNPSRQRRYFPPSLFKDGKPRYT